MAKLRSRKGSASEAKNKNAAKVGKQGARKLTIGARLENWRGWKAHDRRLCNANLEVLPRLCAETGPSICEEDIDSSQLAKWMPIYLVLVRPEAPQHLKKELMGLTRAVTTTKSRLATKISREWLESLQNGGHKSPAETATEDARMSNSVSGPFSECRAMRTLAAPSTQEAGQVELPATLTSDNAVRKRDDNDITMGDGPEPNGSQESGTPTPETDQASTPVREEQQACSKGVTNDSTNALCDSESEIGVVGDVEGTTRVSTPRTWQEIRGPGNLTKFQQACFNDDTGTADTTTPSERTDSDIVQSQRSTWKYAEQASASRSTTSSNDENPTTEQAPETETPTAFGGDQGPTMPNPVTPMQALQAECSDTPGKEQSNMSSPIRRSSDVDPFGRVEEEYEEGGKAQDTEEAPDGSFTGLSATVFTHFNQSETDPTAESSTNILVDGSEAMDVIDETKLGAILGRRDPVDPGEILSDDLDDFQDIGSGAISSGEFELGGFDALWDGSVDTSEGFDSSGDLNTFDAGFYDAMAMDAAFWEEMSGSR